MLQDATSAIGPWGMRAKSVFFTTSARCSNSMIGTTRRVRWVSKEDGDGAGYDIASFSPEGRERLIEVKTTNGWERTPFHISRNELEVAAERRDDWCLFRLYDFARAPQTFELRPPLDAHVILTATNFQAIFQ